MSAVKVSQKNSSYIPSKRPFVVVTFTFLMIFGLMFSGIHPAEAASRNLGGKSCTGGTVATTATGNRTIVHTALRGDVRYEKSFKGGAKYRQTTFYTKQKIITSSNVSNGAGGRFTAARIFCDH